MSAAFVQWPDTPAGGAGMALLVRQAGGWAIGGLQLIGGLGHPRGLRLGLATPDQGPALASIARRLGAERVLFVVDDAGPDGPGEGA